MPTLLQLPTGSKKNECPNCEEIMQMKGCADHISICTTTYFSQSSALSRFGWNDAKYVRGMYAASRVTGRLFEDLELGPESHGIKYPPRGQTDQGQFAVIHTVYFSPASYFPYQSY
ncbi:hypothetical protein BKA82DRAFT_152774 [Pisolithus tinctorius]|uniref:Uncharacterized protein n=1 Tax=Pisolithus tinctorius Marx 270 TaxID=870435 RepID=A0A0C3JSN4_PISTI|nr:hypothetical protein BKA82DRAFT_152774 [Pisolithus tinctorius]KIO00487.1 hypothetical protein M404DRAFT_152774 [Pisolithus tinctorius Marx 270]